MYYSLILSSYFLMFYTVLKPKRKGERKLSIVFLPAGALLNIPAFQFRVIKALIF